MDNYSARALVQKAARDAKPVRTVDEVKAAMDVLRLKRNELQEEERELRRELGEAQLREATPHPLVGKRVKRRHRGPWSDSPWTMQRGTMEQNTSTVARYVGTGQYRVVVNPGGHYVRTLSGRGGYDVKVDSRNEAWELDT